MICCDIRKKAIRKLRDDSISLGLMPLEQFKKFYLAHIAPLFLLKENCCSQCQIFRKEFQKAEEVFGKEPEKVKIGFGEIVATKALFQKENYSQENIFYFGCENKDKAQGWIKTKAGPLGKDVIWIADKSLKELGVIRKEREEEKLIDNLPLKNSFLLIFFPFSKLKRKGDMDFSQTYAVIIDEAHRECLKKDWNKFKRSLRSELFHCEDCLKVVGMIEEFKRISREAFLSRNEDEVDRLGRITYDKIIACKREKGSLCENVEKYLLEMKRVLRGTKYEVAE